RSTWTDTPIPPDEPLAQNPPAGAILEFFLPRDARQPLMLEVLDGSGAVVRRFRSDDAPVPSAEELARELIPAYWLKPPQVLPAPPPRHAPLGVRSPLSSPRGRHPRLPHFRRAPRYPTTAAGTARSARQLPRASHLRRAAPRSAPDHEARPASQSFRRGARTPVDSGDQPRGAPHPELASAAHGAVR